MIHIESLRACSTTEGSVSVGIPRQQIANDDQQEITVQRPLVDFVNDDVRHTAYERIPLKPSQQNTWRNRPKPHGGHTPCNIQQAWYGECTAWRKGRLDTSSRHAPVVQNNSRVFAHRRVSSRI